MKKEKFIVTGMTCAACEANVTRRVKKLDGVKNVAVNLLAGRMDVEYDETLVNADGIIAAVVEIGYGAYLPKDAAGSEKSDFRSEWQKRQQTAESERAQMKRRVIISIALLIPLMYVAMGGMMGLPVPGFIDGMENSLINALVQLFLAAPILLINKHFYQNGFKALIKRAPNMDSLIAVGSGASLLYGIYAVFGLAYGFGHGNMELVHTYAHALYFESAAMILALVTLGKYLEARSKAKTSDALGKLVDLAPKTATVIRDGIEVEIPAEQVQTGDVVSIKPGGSIPVDGVIVEGYGYVDQSAITGESIPVEKGVGDEVISATINKNGAFRFRAARVGEDTTLARIIRLVDEAGSTKAPIARLADRVSGVFVPVVMAIAVLTAIVWLAVGQTFEFALSNAIAVLVISCPCALGLATPVAIMAGTGKAAEYGILIKSAESLERLHEMDTVVLDKTGTITSGHPSVTHVLVLDEALCERDFIALAAAAESGSEHPLAQAVTEHARRLGVNPPAAQEFDATAGRGVRAVVKGRNILAGNAAFLRENGVEADDLIVQRFAAEGKTPLLFAADGKLAGVIAVADTIRASSREAIRRMREMGLHVVMLTGDNRTTAEAIRTQLEIEQVIAEVLPAEKEAHIRALQEQGRRVIMVGDGINDAPALTRADVGIAIGAGTDIAIESADVVLMKDSLADVVTAVELSASVVRNIHMNLFWAFFYNVLGIPVAAGALFPAFGIRLSPMIGSAAMSLSSVSVVTNALRLRWFEPKNPIVTECTDACGIIPPEDNSGEVDISGEETPVESKGETEMKKVLIVEGMMCMHCKAHVEKALAAVDGVESAVVDLEKKQATVALTKDVANDVLTAAVKDAGYEPISCENA